MAGKIKEGQSVYIPFVDGESVVDGNFATRVYTSKASFKKNYRDWDDPELVEYAPVKYGEWTPIYDDIDGALEGWTHEDCGRTTNEASEYCPTCGAYMVEAQADYE